MGAAPRPGKGGAARESTGGGCRIAVPGDSRRPDRRASMPDMTVLPYPGPRRGPRWPLDLHPAGGPRRHDPGPGHLLRGAVAPGRSPVHSHDLARDRQAARGELGDLVIRDPGIRGTIPGRGLSSPGRQGRPQRLIAQTEPGPAPPVSVQVQVEVTAVAWLQVAGKAAVPGDNSLFSAGGLAGHGELGEPGQVCPVGDAAVVRRAAAAHGAFPAVSQVGEAHLTRDRENGDWQARLAGVKLAERTTQRQVPAWAAAYPAPGFTRIVPAAQGRPVGHSPEIRHVHDRNARLLTFSPRPPRLTQLRAAAPGPRIRIPAADRSRISSDRSGPKTPRARAGGPAQWTVIRAPVNREIPPRLRWASCGLSWPWFPARKSGETGDYPGDPGWYRVPVQEGNCLPSRCLDSRERA